MLIDLTDTTTGAVRGALTRARDQLGGPATGVVLNLIIMTDESAPVRRGAGRRRRPAASTRAGCSASSAGGPGGRRGSTPRSGRATAPPGETVLLRLYGPTEPARRLGGACRCWCRTPRSSPGGRATAPDVPAGDAARARWPSAGSPTPRRRATPVGGAEPRAAGYQPGDTDLAWTRATPWRRCWPPPLDQPRRHDRSAAGSTREARQPDRRPAGRLAASRLGVAGRPRGLRRPRHHRGAAATDDGDIAISRAGRPGRRR